MLQRNRVRPLIEGCLGNCEAFNAPSSCRHLRLVLRRLERRLLSKGYAIRRLPAFPGAEIPHRRGRQHVLLFTAPVHGPGLVRQDAGQLQLLPESPPSHHARKTAAKVRREVEVFLAAAKFLKEKLACRVLQFGYFVSVRSRDVSPSWPSRRVERSQTRAR